MGIAAGVLFTAGCMREFHIPLFTKLQPVGGFAAETGAAIAIYTATALGVVISTTHTIKGAIIGVGATRRLSAVRWGVASRIAWAWVATIPGAAGIGALTYLGCRLFGLV
jgi:PiT family inorganic phosphate transporter